MRNQETSDWRAIYSRGLFREGRKIFLWAISQYAMSESGRVVAFFSSTRYADVEKASVSITNWSINELICNKAD